MELAVHYRTLLPFIPKDSTAVLLLEGRTHLLRLLQEIPLGETQQAAVVHCVVAYENLLSKLSGMPTPAGQRRVSSAPGWSRSLFGRASFDAYRLAR